MGDQRDLGVSGGDGGKPSCHLNTTMCKNVVWDHPNKINIIGSRPACDVLSSSEYSHLQFILVCRRLDILTAVFTFINGVLNHFLLIGYL